MTACNEDSKKACLRPAIDYSTLKVIRVMDAELGLTTLNCFDVSVVTRASLADVPSCTYSNMICVFCLGFLDKYVYTNRASTSVSDCVTQSPCLVHMNVQRSAGYTNGDDHILSLDPTICVLILVCGFKGVSCEVINRNECVTWLTRPPIG